LIDRRAKLAFERRCEGWEASVVGGVSIGWRKLVRRRRSNARHYYGARHSARRLKAVFFVFPKSFQSCARIHHFRKGPAKNPAFTTRASMQYGRFPLWTDSGAGGGRSDWRALKAPIDEKVRASCLFGDLSWCEVRVRLVHSDIWQYIRGSTHDGARKGDRKGWQGRKARTEEGEGIRCVRCGGVQRERFQHQLRREAPL
jgi:hypothetical protein